MSMSCRCLDKQYDVEAIGDGAGSCFLLVVLLLLLSVPLVAVLMLVVLVSLLVV